MWIEIKKDIFDGIDIKNLQFLLNIIFETKGSKYSKAKLYLDLNNIIESDLYTKLDGIDQELIQDSIRSSSYEDEIKINYFISNQIEQDFYNLEEAIELLKEPFWIMLENSKNEQEFIKAIIFHFEIDTDYLNTAIKNRWIQFDNAGGCGNVKNVINGRLKSFENLSVKYNTNTIKYYRAFVLLDGDNDFLGQAMKEDYNKLNTFLEGINVNLHILKKRAMENYMPDEVIFEIRNGKYDSRRPDDKDCVKWINVYQYLNDIQKDYLKYAGHVPFVNLPLDAQNIYINQLYPNYEILKKGINYRDNGHNLEEDARRFKNAFPRLFTESPLINKTSLEKRCNSDELQRIYNTISNLL